VSWTFLKVLPSSSNNPPAQGHKLIASVYVRFPTAATSVESPTVHFDRKHVIRIGEIDEELSAGRIDFELKQRRR
jgi:hypothetical protein